MGGEQLMASSPAACCAELGMLFLEVSNVNRKPKLKAGHHNRNYHPCGVNPFVAVLFQTS